MPNKPLVFTCVAIAAAGPVLLHGHPTRDCNPHVELCGLSEVAYLPDEPAPEHAPSTNFASSDATLTSTTTMSGVSLARSFRSPAVY